MRLVVWNCATALHGKFAALAGLKPDVAIVPESEPPSVLAKRLRATAPSSGLWTGDGEKKGLSVFAFGDFQVRLDESHNTNLKYFLPVHVDGPHSFRLFAVWAFHHRLPHSLKVVQAGATGRMDRALQYYAEFLSSGLLVVAGDFNDNIRWDKPRGRWSHGKTVKRLRDFGLVSAYHTFHTVAQGAEQHPTMYWRDRKKGGPAYHIDYCFIPAAWRVAAADVGEFDPWVRLSDHVPLIIDVDPMGANEGDIRGRR